MLEQASRTRMHNHLKNWELYDNANKANLKCAESNKLESKNFDFASYTSKYSEPSKIESPNIPILS